MQTEVNKSSQPKPQKPVAPSAKASPPKETEVGMVSFARIGNAVYIDTESGRIGPYTASQAMAQALGEIRRMLFRSER